MAGSNRPTRQNFNNIRRPSDRGSVATEGARRATIGTSEARLNCASVSFNVDINPTRIVPHSTRPSQAPPTEFDIAMLNEYGGGRGGIRKVIVKEETPRGGT
jgi:hypothetical protein